MLPLRFPVVVVMERVPLQNRWVSERWQPAAVIPGPAPGAAPAVTPPQLIADGPDGTRWSCAGFEVELHPSEAEGYHLNLTAPEPKAFVAWRPAEDALEPAMRPHCVTLSYNQAARMLDGGEQVDAVPLPDALKAWMEPFVAAHYKPEPRKKIRRNDPFRDAEGAGGRRR
jgi:hypothetical protein